VGNAPDKPAIIVPIQRTDFEDKLRQKRRIVPSGELNPVFTNAFLFNRENCRPRMPVSAKALPFLIDSDAENRPKNVTRKA
jgi:hypothetical protein